MKLLMKSYINKKKKDVLKQQYKKSFYYLLKDFHSINIIYFNFEFMLL